jgi:predicted transcriptional regulator
MRYISDMTMREILALVDRIRTWPAEKQQLAYDLLTWIEAKDEDDASDLTDEDWADLEEGLAEADRGEFVPEEEMKAFFDKYR